MTDQQSTTPPQPGERPLHDPVTAIAPKLATVLVRRVRVVDLRRDDRLDPAPGQPLPVARCCRSRDPTPIGPASTAAAPGGVLASPGPRRSSSRGASSRSDWPSPGVLPAEYPRHRPEASTWFPCPSWSFRLRRPLFRGGEAPIPEALVPAHLGRVIQVRQKGPPQREQRAILVPLAQSPPARGRAAVRAGQRPPRRARPQDPQDALEALPRVRRGAPAARTPLATRQMRGNPCPLRVAQPSTERHGSPPCE